VTLDDYAGFIARHPFVVLIVSLLVTTVIAYGAGYVETVNQGQSDILPDSLPSVAAFDTISKEFSSESGTSYTILLEAQPSSSNSTEIRDLRDPRALRFTSTVTNDISSFDNVRSVNSLTSLLDDIPSSKRQVKERLSTLGQSRWSGYLTDDYTASQIQIQSRETNTGVDLADRIRLAVESNDKPAGINVVYTGQPYIDEAFQEQSGQTMALTGLVAVIGVFAVVIYMFRSLTYGLTALSTLIFGVIAGYGIFGWLGLNMSPGTSGAITMGIGVAIDFGIQPIARYLEERQGLDMESALQETMTGVITPMTIGLLAANIGFLSLNVGRVTFLSDLGSLLTFTTTMAYVAAFTVTPAILIIYDIYFTDDNGYFSLAVLLNNEVNQ
jgi:predicted RND superfamily exporter protein